MNINQGDRQRCITCGLYYAGPSSHIAEHMAKCKGPRERLPEFVSPMPYAREHENRLYEMSVDALRDRVADLERENQALREQQIPRGRHEVYCDKCAGVFDAKKKVCDDCDAYQGGIKNGRRKTPRAKKEKTVSAKRLGRGLSSLIP